MTKESSKAISTSILQAEEALRALRPSINVRGAAKRLGVSISAVYRLDREHGPICFLSATRPITIDLASLETHVANTKSIELEPVLVTDMVPCSCPYEDQAEEIESGTSELLAEPVLPAAPSHLSPPSSSCGQRELGLIRRDGAAVITYLSYI
jgi:hypothetical protein